MLVLSRKAGEKILIGDKISVTVVRIGPGVVRIGINAPSDMAILREELTDSGTEIGGSEAFFAAEPTVTVGNATIGPVPSSESVRVAKPK
jgi:carbon storage regulator